MINAAFFVMRLVLRVMFVSEMTADKHVEKEDT
jgi:hypothetical protein